MTGIIVVFMLGCVALLGAILTRGGGERERVPVRTPHFRHQGQRERNRRMRKG